MQSLMAEASCPLHTLLHTQDILCQHSLRLLLVHTHQMLFDLRCGYGIFMTAEVSPGGLRLATQRTGGSSSKLMARSCSVNLS
jgi:hypothetical protein